MYVFDQEDEAMGRKRHSDCSEAPAGGCADGTKSSCGGCDPDERSDGGYVLSLATVLCLLARWATTHATMKIRDDVSRMRREWEAHRVALRDVQCPRCNGHGRVGIIALAQHSSI
jgi:hypothetical protein